MAICEGWVPGKTRIGGKARKCGALAEPGQTLCAPHLKQSGYLRCSCGTWVPPASLQSRIAGKCPNCGAVHELKK